MASRKPHKSVISPIGHAIIDLIDVYNKAKEMPHIQKPISFALYYTWEKYDKKEQSRKL